MTGGGVDQITSPDGTIDVGSGAGPDVTVDVVYGTAADTAAEGNDSRITGALQSANNLDDVASVATARTNLGLGSAATQPSSAFDAAGAAATAQSNAESYTDTALESYAPLMSPALTGMPTAPIAAEGTDTAQIATTAFVINEIAGGVTTLAGDPVAVTAATTLTAASPYQKQLVSLVASTALYTVTLPDATTCAGMQIRLYKSPLDVGTYAVTLAPLGSQTIGGASQVGLLGPSHFFELFSDGSNWQIAGMTRVLYAGGGNQLTAWAGSRYYWFGSNAPSSPHTYDFWYNTSGPKLEQYSGSAWTTIVASSPTGASAAYPVGLDGVVTGSSPAASDPATAFSTATFVVPPSGEVHCTLNCGGSVSSTSDAAAFWFALFDVGLGDFVTSSQVASIFAGPVPMRGQLEHCATTTGTETVHDLVPGDVYTWQACWKPGNDQTNGAWITIDNSDASFRIEAVGSGL